jgi:N-acyl-D-aspartate/D-glutamate deacylase/Leucine-rich repeat (LRR) protein
MVRLLFGLVVLWSAYAQPLDILIRGGKLVDGSGNPWRMADVGIRAGKIVAVGELGAAAAAKTMDAKGMVVAPGFIDIHNHSDDTIVADGNAESMIRQGVTSMIFGEGGSAAPLGGKQSDRARNADWTDFSGYFARLLKQGISPNVGSYVGSSQIWTYVRGPQAGPPTPAEVTEMQGLVRTAMQQGALGVASSLSGPPGAWIDTATLIAMCKVAAEHGGIYSTHMRTEGQGVFESVAEALEIGRQAKIPVDIIHLKIADHKLWGRMPELVATIRQARANGQQVEAHVYPYRAGQNNLSSILPPWAHEGGSRAMLDRLKNPELRTKIREQVLNGIPGTNWYNHYTATGSWEGMLLVSLSNPEFKRFEGKRMNEVIAALGGEGVDVLFKVLEANNGSIPTIYFHHNEDDMRHALQQPFVSIGSDGTAVKTEGPLARGNPHPRYYGTFPRVLGRYVRDEKVITLEEAIRKMTSANAAKVGIYDRGIIRPGAWADITIFNPQTVIDNSTWEKPHQYSSGIEHVLVNGTVVLDKGQHTNAHPGKILYGSGYKAAPATASAVPVPATDREAAEWVLRYGGKIRLAGQTRLIESLPQLPEGDFKIASVDLVGTTIDPVDMKKLSGLAELTELFLPGTIFNPGAGSRLDVNDQLKSLAGLKKLEKLHFSLHFLTNINVQDKGLTHLKDLPNLKELRLTQTRVKGSSLAPFTNLRKLDLDYSTFADEGMQYLVNMKQLTHLSLRDTLVSDAGLKHISGLTNLIALDLYGAPVTDAGVKHLAALKKLQKLNLLGASISDEGLDVIASLPALEELNLYRSQITNAGLSKLRGLPHLRSLDLRYTRVTRGGIEDFRRARPNAEIEFQDTAAQLGAAELRQTRPVDATEKAVADWVSKMGGKATIREGAVREVDLSRTPVSDSQLAHLTSLTSIESLDLESTETGDLAATHIAELPSLRRLNLSHTVISDKALPSFRKLGKLEKLLLAHTLVNGSGMADLLAIPALRELSLAGCEIEDESLASIGKATQLRSLDLSYTELTDAGAAHLKGLGALERLDLTATEIGDEGLPHIASLPALKHLLISYGRFTDKGIDSLKGLVGLETLEMARTRATDAALPSLAAMKNLRRLNLDYTSVTDKGLVTLAESLPQLEQLRLDTATITDSGVDTLLRLKNLKELNLYHTLITDAGFERLKSGLPDCRIIYDRESALPNRRRS